MNIKEMRDILYCHLMDLESNHPGSFDADIWRIKEALNEAVNYFDREMAYIRANSAK